MSAGAATSPTRSDLLEIVWWACRAPSVHNTQPWHWSVDGVLELRADEGRRLAATDPLGRHVVISGGAALDHAVTAARALGWRTSVDRLPDPHRPDLLARIEVEPGGGSDRGDLVLIEHRWTDRRLFSSWQVPPVRVEALARAAERRGAHAVAMTDPVHHALVEKLVQDALWAQPRAVDEEADRWVGRDPREGVPRASLPSGPVLRHPANRFGLGELPDRGDPAGSAESWVVLGSAHDDPADWLATGEGLSALWLEAVRSGLAVQPVTHVVEAPGPRDALRAAIGWLPQVLLRLGWPQGEAPSSARAGRRRVFDVVDF